MKHSDYIGLTRRLTFLAGEIGRTRALLTMPLTVTPDGDIVASSTTIPDGTPVEVNRGPIRRAVDEVGNSIAGRMDGLLDGFVEANQGRADQDLDPTDDVRTLFDAMGAFMDATDEPIQGAGRLYEPVRTRCREWMEMANGWFPGLNDQGAGKKDGDGPKDIVPNLDRAKLEKFFLSNFCEPTPRIGMEPLSAGLDRIITRILTGNLCATDYGRMAYCARLSKVTKPVYKRMDFAKFARLFCEACGVPAPKYLSPNKYKPTKQKDFSGWFE